MTVRLTDPTRIGPALGDIRVMLGIPRRALARTLANATCRNVSSLNAQLWQWDKGHHMPDLASLPAYLDALGYDLALVPKEDA
jgi:hypothetical protein